MSDSNDLLHEDFSDISGDEFDDLPFEDIIDNKNEEIIYEDIKKSNDFETDDIFEADAHLLDLEIETQTLSLDEVSYNRDLKYINTASKDKPKLVLFENSTNRSRRDKTKKQLKQQEINNIGKLYIDPDEIIKKKNDYDTNNAGSRSRRRKGSVESNIGQGELIDVFDKKKKNSNQKKNQYKMIVNPKIIANNPNRMNRQDVLNQENNSNSHLYNNPYSNSMNIQQSNYYQNQGNSSTIHYNYPSSVPIVESKVDTNIPLSQFSLRASASVFIPTFIPSKPPAPPTV